MLAGVVSADALGWIGRPWSGFGMHPDGSVAPLGLSPLRLAATTRQLRFEDRIVAVDGVAVDGATGVRAAVEGVGQGTPLRYTVRRAGLGDLEFVIPTTVFTAGDYVELFLPLLLGGLVGIALGLFPVLARPDLLTTRLFFLGQLGLAVNFGFLAFDAYLVHHLPRWGFLGAGL